MKNTAAAGDANPPKNRETLKSYFRRGSLPTEQNYADLIDSTVNCLDDGFVTAPGYGMQLVADPADARLTSFYQNPKSLDDSRPAWFIDLNRAHQPDGLNFSEVQLLPMQGREEPETARNGPGRPAPGISRLHLQAGGNVGVGTTSPQARLDVRGFVASQGRIGGYVDAQHPHTEVPADGQWHPILADLDGLHAFEIVAAAYGPRGRGRYALTHATALSAYGKSRSRIFRQNAWFWGFFQKIQFRWTGSLHQYGLEMRTASSFGADARIVYYITHLFDDRRPLLPH